MTKGQKISVCVVTTLAVTLASFWFMEQSPPSVVGRFVRAQEDVLFPFAWMGALFLGHALWLTYPLALFQFPAYSIVLEWAWLRRRIVLTALVVFALHFIAAVYCRSFRE